MKFLAYCFILFMPFLTQAQFAPGFWKVSSYISAGEYFPIGYDSVNHQAYHSLNITPEAFTGQPAYIGGAWGGPHDAALIDTLGHVYFSGGNPAGEDGFGNTTGTATGAMVEVTTDSAGVTLPPVKQVLLTGTNYSQYWINVIVTTTGAVGMAGNLQGGIRGNGTTGSAAQTTFVWVPFPAGTFIEKIQGLYSLLALDSAGNPWSWGAEDGSYGLGRTGTTTVPGKITLPTGWRCIDIASTGIFSWLLLDSAGHRKLESFGWQPDPAYQGLGSGNSGSVQVTPVDVTNNAWLSKMTGSHTPAKIFANNESTYFICSDGTLWSIGGNACGTIGNGKSIDFATYSPVYEWNQSQNANNQDTIYNVAPGTSNWTNVYTGYSNSWYVYAQRSDGSLYGWGRNKGAALWGLWNGVQSVMVIDANYTNGGIGSQYPDSWECVWPTYIKWPATTVISQATCPYCIANPSGSPCNIYTVPVTAAPTVSAGSTQNLSGGTTTTTMAGSSSGNGGSYVNSTVWTQTSGPNTAVIQFPSSATTTMTGLTNGTYVFQLLATDNNWRTNTSNVTVNISSFTPPTVNAGSNQTITLPLDSITLTGTATGNGGATISSTTWSQISGPNSATIEHTTNLTTNVTGLIAGSYVFQLSATDSNSQTSNSQVTITVNSTSPSSPYFIRKKYGKLHFQ